MEWPGDLSVMTGEWLQNGDACWSPTCRTIFFPAEHRALKEPMRYCR